MVTLKNEKLTVMISELGAEPKSIKLDGVEYLWEGRKEVWGSSGPIMFPICGGLKDDKYILDGKEYSLPKHGFAKISTFEVESATDSRVVFLLKSDEETKKMYPFDYEFRAIYSVEGTTLSVRYEVKNLTDGTMYFSIGSHEGYYTPEGIEDYDVVFPQNETLDAYVLYGNLCSKQRLPIIKDTNVLPLYDKYFTVDALVFKDLKSRSATLRNRKTGKAVRVDFPYADFFVLWHKPNSPYICLEPWAGVQDPVDTDCNIKTKEGIIALEAGKTFIGDHNITIVQ